MKMLGPTDKLSAFMVFGYLENCHNIPDYQNASNNIPTARCLNMYETVFNHFQMSAYTQGLQTLLEKIVGPKGSFHDSDSLLDLVRRNRRSVPRTPRANIEHQYTTVNELVKKFINIVFFYSHYSPIVFLGFYIFNGMNSNGN